MKGYNKFALAICVVAAVTRRVSLQSKYHAQNPSLYLGLRGAKRIPPYENKKDTPCDYDFSGKRISRGVYRSKHELLIHADVNGAGNIIRKVVPDAFVAEGIVAVVTPPCPLILKGFYEKTQRTLKDNGITKKLPAQCAA